MGVSPFTESSVLESKQYAQPFGNLMGAYFKSDNPTGTRAMSTVGTTRKRPKTGGRVKGTPNKVNRDFRETVRKLLDDNADNVGTWITQVAEGHGENKADPAKALDLLAKLAEFAAPKLGRIEHTGKDGGPMESITRIELVDMDDDGED